MEIKVIKIKKNWYRVNGRVIRAKNSKAALKTYVNITMGGAKVAI